MLIKGLYVEYLTSCSIAPLLLTYELAEVLLIASEENQILKIHLNWIYTCACTVFSVGENIWKDLLAFRLSLVSSIASVGKEMKVWK